MAQLWEDQISTRTISRGWQKRFMRKKAYGYQDRDEAKRQIFLQVTLLTSEQVVHVDKPETDQRDDCTYSWNAWGSAFMLSSQDGVRANST